MPYVYSTLSTSMDYATYHKGGGDLDVVHNTVTVNGGANVMNADPDKGLYTPRGVVTQVTDAELEELKQNPLFKLHVDNGFITYDNQEVAVEKKIRDMKNKDKSAPKTPDDYKNGGPTPGGKKIAQPV